MAEMQWPYVPESEIGFGDMGLPSYVNLPAVIEQAARDMDASIGQRYSLPLSLDDEKPEHVAPINLLRKINRYLAIGRVVVDAAIGGEDTQMHAYGIYHIRSAEQALKQIVDGTFVIPGATVIIEEDRRVTGPMMTLKDKHSLVDSFYAADPFFDAVNNGGVDPW